MAFQLCRAGRVKGKRRVKGPCCAADQMFVTLQHCCSSVQNPLLQEVGPALCILEQPWQGVCPCSSHPWPGLLADGSSVLICVLMDPTLLLVCRMRERCLGRGDSAVITCFPLLLFPPLCSLRGCACFWGLMVFCEGLGCHWQSWNAILQLGAPQPCLLHVQSPALPVHPSCCPVPSESLRGWWHSRHS